MGLVGLLSDIEKSQLGKRKIGASGKPTAYRYTTEKEWLVLRGYLLGRSKDSNPLLDPALTAYTPGETLSLLNHPAVQKWHREFRHFEVPGKYEAIALVPCAKTKPWKGATRGIYASYNRLIGDVGAGRLPPVYFATISEPLGIVPQSEWASFPQYDNPGLFRDLAMRSSMMKEDWLECPLGQVREMPYDPEAYKKCIKRLAGIISDFMNANSDKRILSFVEDFYGKGTHSHMLDYALEKAPAIREGERYMKRAGRRQPPYEHIFSKLKKIR